MAQLQIRLRRTKQNIRLSILKLLFYDNGHNKLCFSLLSNGCVEEKNDGNELLHATVPSLGVELWMLKNTVPEDKNMVFVCTGTVSALFTVLYFLTDESKKS